MGTASPTHVHAKEQFTAPSSFSDELPINVRQAAVFLGVSPQTVYLWVERKQIPHLRVWAARSGF